jgi:hypothetical protein
VSHTGAAEQNPGPSLFADFMPTGIGRYENLTVLEGSLGGGASTLVIDSSTMPETVFRVTGHGLTSDLTLHDVFELTGALQAYLAQTETMDRALYESAIEQLLHVIAPD